MPKKTDHFLPVNASDRRTIPAVKRLAKRLTDLFKPSEIAESLGISTQKWVATRKKIKSGDVYGKQVRGKLERLVDREESRIERVAQQNERRLAREVEKERKAEKRATEKERKAERKAAAEAKRVKKKGLDVSKEKAGEFYFKDHKQVKEVAPSSRIVKTVGGKNGLADAVKWWEGIAGGSDYFVIRRSKSRKQKGQYLYHVVDIRTPRERGAEQKGKLGGQARASQLLQQAFDMDDDSDDDFFDDEE